MNKYLNSILIALGLMIASALIQFTSIAAINVLITGAIIFTLALLASFIAHNTSSETNHKSSKHNHKTTKAKSSNGKTVDGTVKWFNKTKGFGFITQSNGDDVFVHQTSIASKPSILKEGQAVTMNVVNDIKGPQAENVKVA